MDSVAFVLMNKIINENLIISSNILEELIRMPWM